MKKSDVAVSGPSRAIEIVPSLCPSFVSRVRSSLIGANSSFARVDAGLNDLDFDLVVRLVVLRHRAVEPTAVVEVAVHVAEEVGDGGRRLRGVQLSLDVAL